MADRASALVRFKLGTVALQNPTLRLLCWPHAGGAAHVFQSWARALAPSGIEVLAVELPGRGTRFSEALKTSWRDALDDVWPSLASAIDGGPFAFFGHSMGGTLAFEAARRLRAEGRPPPSHLFIAASAVPHRGYHHPRSPLHLLPDGALTEVLATLNGTPRELLENRELMELLLPVLRADFGIVETYAYEPAPPLDVPMSLLLGEKDGDVEAASARREWTQHAAAPMAIHVFAGDHFFPHSERDAVLATLVETLRPR